MKSLKLPTEHLYGLKCDRRFAQKGCILSVRMTHCNDLLSHSMFMLGWFSMSPLPRLHHHGIMTIVEHLYIIIFQHHARRARRSCRTTQNIEHSYACTFVAFLNIHIYEKGSVQLNHSLSRDQFS